MLPVKEPPSLTGQHLQSSKTGSFVLGVELRGYRASKGKSLLDVHKETGLRPFMIHAIENGDLEAFKNKSLILGSVRQYARYLGLDQTEILKRFCKETGHTAVITGASPGFDMVPPMVKHINELSDEAIAAGSYSSIAPDSGQTISSWSERMPIAGVSVVVLATVLLTGGGYLMWTLYAQVQQSRDAALTPYNAGELVQPDISRANLAVINGETIALVNKDDLPRIVELSPDEVFVEPLEAELPPPLAVQLEVAEIDAEDQLAVLEPAESSVDGDEVAISEEVENEELGAGETEEVEAAVAVDQVPIENFALLASQPTWVRVREETGTIHLEKILDTGEQYDIPRVDATLLLRAGNSGHLYFVVDGYLFGPAGTGTEVVKNVELNPQSIRDSYGQLPLASIPEEFLGLAGLKLAQVGN